MLDKTVKYIIPPKLQSRLTFFGFYPHELLIIVVTFFIGFISAVDGGSKFFLLVSVTLIVLLFKGLDGKERCAATQLRLRYRMIFRPQIYSLKEAGAQNGKSKKH